MHKRYINILTLMLSVQKRKEPLSLEEVVAKKREEDERAARPVRYSPYDTHSA